MKDYLNAYDSDYICHTDWISHGTLVMVTVMHADEFCWTVKALHTVDLICISKKNRTILLSSPVMSSSDIDRVSIHTCLHVTSLILLA